MMRSDSASQAMPGCGVVKQASREAARLVPERPSQPPMEGCPYRGTDSPPPGVVSKAQSRTASCHQAVRCSLGMVSPREWNGLQRT